MMVLLLEGKMRILLKLRMWVLLERGDLLVRGKLVLLRVGAEEEGDMVSYEAGFVG